MTNSACFCVDVGLLLLFAASADAAAATGAAATAVGTASAAAAAAWLANAKRCRLLEMLLYTLLFFRGSFVCSGRNALYERGILFLTAAVVVIATWAVHAAEVARTPK